MRGLEGLCRAHELDPCSDCDTDAIHCQECGIQLNPGDGAWASDHHVITPEGVRLETRYTCDDCH